VASRSNAFGHDDRMAEWTGDDNARQVK
jgi:hypothetical protein